jgi:hypothetical protein
MLFSRYEMANYIGIPAVELDALIRQGKMPAPINGKWDRAAVDAAFSAMASPPDGPQERLNKLSGVYFIGFRDYIKVGVSRTIGIRIREIESILPEKITLLGVVAGGTVKEERALHRAFDQYRLNGEWFRSDPFILDYIAKHKSPAP